jgi:hypothetical protein
MPNINCVYGLHFSELALKFQENLSFEGSRLIELIELLEQKYPGFKMELIDSNTEQLHSYNQILLARIDEKTRPLFSIDSEIQDGDTLTIY